VLAALQVPDPPPLRKANPLVGFLDGLALGRVDEHGFDNLGGELGRLAGHLTSGFFALGNARDLVADLWHGHAGEALLDAAFLVPGLGDAGEAGRTVVEAGEEVRAAARVGEEGLAGERWTVDLVEHEGARPLGHTLRDHTGQSLAQMEERLVRKPGLRATSSFPSDGAAENAVNDVLRARRNDIESWLDVPATKPEPFEADLGRPIGEILQRGAIETTQTTSARVVLVQDPAYPLGFRVLTAFPVP